MQKKGYGILTILLCLLFVFSGCSSKATLIEDVETQTKAGSLQENANDLIESSTDFAKANVGDYVVFGHYEQDGNEENGPEPIEWEVLKVEDDRILVISRYVLDSQPYDTQLPEYNEDPMWSTCYLREWLNSYFYSAAFSADENKKIPSVTLKNRDCADHDGIDTQDYIFCLSLDEIQELFDVGEQSSSRLQCKELMIEPTENLLNQGIIRTKVFDEEAFERNQSYGYTSDQIGIKGAEWWLRAPCSSGVSGAVNSASAVSYYGILLDNFRLGGLQVNESVVGVRPAMYISTDGTTNEDPVEGNGTEEEAIEENTIEESTTVDTSYRFTDEQLCEAALSYYIETTIRGMGGYEAMDGINPEASVFESNGDIVTIEVHDGTTTLEWLWVNRNTGIARTYSYEWEIDLSHYIVNEN